MNNLHHHHHYHPRIPREPEATTAQLPLGSSSSLSQAVELAQPSSRWWPGGRQDPPEVSIELNESQLGMLASMQQQQQRQQISANAARRSNNNRNGNHPYNGVSQKQRQPPRDPSVVGVPYSNHHEPQPPGQPPPSSAHTQQQLLHQILQKAGSHLSSSSNRNSRHHPSSAAQDLTTASSSQAGSSSGTNVSGTSSSRGGGSATYLLPVRERVENEQNNAHAVGKRTLKKVLAQQLLHRKNGTTTSSSHYQNKDGAALSSSSASQYPQALASPTMSSSFSSPTKSPTSSSSSMSASFAAAGTASHGAKKKKQSPTAKAMAAVFGGGGKSKQAQQMMTASPHSKHHQPAEITGSNSFSIRERLKRARTPNKSRPEAQHIAADDSRGEENGRGSPPPSLAADSTTSSRGGGGGGGGGLASSWTNRLKKSHQHHQQPKPEQNQQPQHHPKLKVKSSRSLDSAETRDRVKQIVSQHFAGKHHMHHQVSRYNGGGNVQHPPPPPLPPHPSAAISPLGQPAEERAKETVDAYQRSYEKDKNEHDNKDSMEGYDEFFRLLQLEVSGSHTQLWSSFQAAFDASLAPTPPALLDSSLAFPKSRVKFDDKSAAILKKLHSSLKARYPSAGKTQLVNDKAYAKQVRQLPSLAPSSSEDDAGTGVASSQSKPGRRTASTTIDDDPVLKTRSAEEDGSSTDAESRRKEMANDSRSTRDAILTARSEESIMETSLGKKQGKVLGASLSVSTTVSDDDDDTVPSPSSNFSISDLQLRHSRNLPSTSSAGMEPEWARVQLRKTDKPRRESPKCNSVVGASESGVSEMSAFGKLLRGNDEDSNSKADAPTVASSELPTAVVEEESMTANHATDNDGPHETTVAVAAVDSREGEEAIMIRLASLPNFHLTPDETASVLIGKQTVMLISKRSKNESSSRDDDATSTRDDPIAPAPAPARVLWKAPRSDLESLSLDMSTLQVNLFWVEGSEHSSQVLLFETSADCLQFANAFYGRGSTAVASSSSSSAKDRTDESRTEDSARQPVPQDVNITTLESSEHSLISGCDGDSAAQRMEALNDEEQTLLETYRRLRRTKGAQAAMDATIPTELAGAGLDRAASDDAVKPKPIIVREKAEKSTVSDDNETLPRYIHGDPSSPVSLLSQSVLSEVEMVQVQSYRVLLRQNVDPQKVRQKMQNDHVDPKVIAFVLSSDESSTVEAQKVVVLTQEEEEVAKSFRTMLKLNFPVEVIRHRMTKEQVNERIVEAVFGKESDKEMSDTAYVAALTAAEEEVAASYRKMLKLGFGKDVVRHRMKKESVDSKIVDAVLGPETQDVRNPADQSPDPANPPAAVRGKSKGPTLSSEEESVASSYRKMLKIQVPKELVLSRMRQEGVSEKIITAVVGQSVVVAPVPDAAKDTSASSSKLVSLHWTPLSEKELDNSVWRVNSLLEDLDSQPERNDVSKLVSLFQKKTSQVTKKNKPAESSAPMSGKARLLDITRANNVSISLKAFKEFSFKELAEAIAFLDPTRRLPSDKVLFLRDLLPTLAELDTIRGFDGPSEQLVPAELWFREIMSIQRIDVKVQVMQTMETFHSEAESLMENFRLLAQVCHQVMDSDKLVFLLGKVLKIGNIMNEGTRTGGAAGFKFDSLLRLTQTKSADNKITVLDFLVTSLVDQGQRNTLDLSSDFPECQNASRIIVSDLVNAVKDLKESLRKCDGELELLRDTSTKPKRKMGPDAGSGVASNAALLSAILARTKGNDGPPKPERFTQRDQFLAAIKEKSSEGGNKPDLGGPNAPIVVDDLSVDKSPADASQNTAQAGVTRLKTFMLDAKRAFDELDLARSDALKACAGLARYCGESGGTSATSTLLGILATFATNLQEALNRYDAKQLAEARKRKKKGDDSSTLYSDSASFMDGMTASETDEGAKGKSLVILVNDMLKGANDRTKEDFIKGRVYPNPSSTLKAIYARERLVLAKESSPPVKSSRQSLIVSAILEQEADADSEEALRARSCFGTLPNAASQEPTRPKPTPEALPTTAPAESPRPIGVKEARALFEEKLRFPAMIAPVVKAKQSSLSLSEEPKGVVLDQTSNFPNVEVASSVEHGHGARESERSLYFVPLTDDKPSDVTDKAHSSPNVEVVSSVLPEPCVKESERSLYYVPLTNFANEQPSASDVKTSESDINGPGPDLSVGADAVSSDEACASDADRENHAASNDASEPSPLPCIPVKIGEVRKARSLLERLVGKSSPQPTLKIRPSLLSTPPSSKKANRERTTGALDDTPSSIDLSGSKKRLLQKESSPAKAQKTMTFSRPTGLPVASPEASPPPRTKKENEPRKSLLEMAREKRDSHQHVKDPSPLKTQAKESPVLMLAREKRMGKKSDDTAQLVPDMTVSESLSNDSRESAVSLMARQKRDERNKVRVV